MQTVPFSVQIINQLKAPLKIIFEKSLNESTVPEVLKQPTFGAMFKQGENQKPVNYIPITFVAVRGKLMDKIIKDALVQHMYNI